MSSLLVLATLTFVFLFYHRLGLALVSPFTGGFEPLRISNSISYLIYWAFYPLGRSFQVGAFRFYWTLSSLFLGMMGFRFALRSKTLTKTFWYSCIFLLLLILVFSPNYQPWYLTWVLPFGVAIPDKRIRELLLSYSVLSIFTYPILCGPTAALLVIIFIGLLWKKLGSPLRKGEEQMTSLEIVTSET